MKKGGELTPYNYLQLCSKTGGAGCVRIEGKGSLCVSKGHNRPDPKKTGTVLSAGDAG